MLVNKIKKIVVILSATAYNQLEVSNFQTAVDTCQCVKVKTLFMVSPPKKLDHWKMKKKFFTLTYGFLTNPAFNKQTILP